LIPQINVPLEFDQWKNVVQTEKDAKRIFQRNFGMTYTCKLFGTEGNIPARGWI
jgi:hypothetical protein